jgi:hypothetical protein
MFKQGRSVSRSSLISAACTPAAISLPRQSRKNPKKLVWGLAGLADSEADAGLLDPSAATAAQQILARIPD